MRRTIGRRSARVAVLSLAAGTYLACTDAGRTPVGVGPVDGAPSAARSSGTITVSAANPSFGRQGQSGEAVTISGSGFAPGARASWQRNGLTDTSIAVVSTQYVSSTQLLATINISTAAPISYYDVVVTQDRTKGAGSDAGIGGGLFEVTQAVAISGSNYLRDVNDNGEITGSLGPIYWSPSSGLLQVDGLQISGFAISPLGNAIAANGMPRLYTRSGSVGTAWQVTLLPADLTASDGGAHALIADAVTGQVTLLGGQVRLPGTKHSVLTQPRLWVPQGGGWSMIALSTGTSTQGSVRQISGGSLVVGALGGVAGHGYASSGSQAAMWQPDGLGGWTLSTLAPVPSAGEGINRAGTLIVGSAGGLAAYWQLLPGGAWSAPITLPGGCADARAVDDSGRIVLDGCGATTNSPAGILVPPYSATTMIHLGGLGKGNAGLVEAVSPSGGWVVGTAGGTGGIYWRPF